MLDAAPGGLFETLYARHHPLLRRLAWMLCGDPVLADDLLQETWLRAWRALDALHEPGAAKGWLITILRREHARLFERRQLDCVDLDHAAPVPARDVPPDGALYLRQLLGRMPVADREPLLMQIVDGVPVAEIACRFGVSRNAMTIRLHRLRRRLRELDAA
ncbi:MAG: sigma-70 family RNA polymerase sigma factor [Chromatiaceae bacterium]|nr:sigma-70 family RNA polymerase sigma factor [Gammaproteobacteria bacterium]MCP5300684.1 sigma-70 family RNA polymerase sigma factor [Chromatiaceae bacterium]MCP5422756.1 sigma-70 family RNA polymerase sigma factor [Chromatiaceae bacterium]